jgi:hypothetical protein
MKLLLLFAGPRFLPNAIEKGVVNLVRNKAIALQAIQRIRINTGAGSNHDCERDELFGARRHVSRREGFSDFADLLFRNRQDLLEDAWRQRF